MKQREINSILCHEDVLQRKLFGTTTKNNHHQESILKNKSNHQNQESINKDIYPIIKPDFNAIIHKELSNTLKLLENDSLNENKQNLSDDNLRLLSKIQ